MNSKNVYLAGDVQGCFDSLMALLAQIRFDPKHDELIICGDLVNRGPKSREVLDFCIEHSGTVRVVLGNHDIYLLGRLFDVAKRKDDDTLDCVVKSSNANQYREWIRNQPLALMQDGYVAAHAGFHPDWTLDDGLMRAHEVSKILSSAKARDFLGSYFNQKISRIPAKESSDWEKRSFDLRVLTSIRTVNKIDHSLTKFTDDLSRLPSDEMPWFDSDSKLHSTSNAHVFFGHWAALGYYSSKNVTCLDSGCVWGRKLTAQRWADKKIFQVDAVEPPADRDD